MSSAPRSKKPRSGRRGNREGTAPVQRSDGRWCAAVSLDGCRRKYVYGRTRREVADKLAAILKDAHLALPIPSERLTTAAYLDDWLEHTVKPYRRPGTYLRYKTATRLHIIPVIGKVPLARFGPEHVEQVQNALRAQGTSAATVALVRACLCPALHKAERQRKIARNPVPLADAPTRR